MPNYNNPSKTWAYSNEFKIKAVKLSYQPDIQSKQVADGLWIHRTIRVALYRFYVLSYLEKRG
jgi:hypothetical protein